jgi:hypothetical protein
MAPKQALMIDFIEGKLYRFKAKRNEWVEIGHKKEGYLVFKQNKKHVFIHRFIFERYNSVSLKPAPIEEINHRNHIKDDNRPSNLEVVSGKLNLQYQPLYKNNTSGYKNIRLDEKLKKYSVSVRIDKKTTHFGYFTQLQDAIDKRNQVLSDLNSKGYNYFIPDNS